MFSLLHIDNNFFYKEILMNISKERQFQYFSAKTPEKAFEILKNNPIDIIVTGLEFQNVSGEAFIQELNQIKHRSTPVVVLSATEDPVLKQRLFELGVTEYLSKDRFLDYLMRFIEKLKIEDVVTAQLKTLKIAVLDDNETHLATIKNYLDEYEIHNVDFYVHPNALLASQRHYNLYIVDLILPDISGDEVIASLRSKDEYAVILAVSSLDTISVMTDVLASGADDYITKPITQNLFMARLKANVRTYSLMEELKNKNLKLEYLIKEDGLTGLLNHKCIMETLENEIDRAHRYRTPLSIIMFDIDKFKKVNDTYGHHIGDEVLQVLGKFLKSHSRDFDIVGRYGGEEFVVILPETDIRGTILYANRLREEIMALQFSEPDLKITISGGIGVCDDHSAVDLLKQADHYLYKAKNKGRNRIEFE